VRAVEFGSLFEFIRNGMNIKQDKSGDGLPITRIETISNSSIDPKRVGFAGLEEADSKDWFLKHGDILFSHINSVEHIGKCAVYEGLPEKLVHGMNLLCLRPDSKQLTPEFAKYLIRGQDFRAKLGAYINKAVNQASVSIGNLKGIQVTVPELEEQRRIAAILDKADALSTKRREALAQLDRLARSIFVEMFGDPATNLKGWSVRTLKDLGKVSTGGTPPSALDDMFGGEIPFITPGDLESDKAVKRTVTLAGAQATGTVRAGAALVCCIGTVGKMGMALVRSSFNQQINAVEWYPMHIHDQYGFAVLRLFKPTIVSWASSTTIPILKKSTFEKITIPVPPIAMQEEFAKRILALRHLEKNMRSDLKVGADLFLAIQSRAFEGRL
jgi:type I restriction enzyme S subunit